MSGKSRGKAKIHMSKPELPPFLQRMKEQIVQNEEIERKEQSERKRKNRVPRQEEPDDDPTVVKLDDDDLSEDEYRKLKKDKKVDPTEPLKIPDLSTLISKKSDDKGNLIESSKKDNKKLSYDSSSEDED